MILSTRLPDYLPGFPTSKWKSTWFPEKATRFPELGISEFFWMLKGEIASSKNMATFRIYLNRKFNLIVPLKQFCVCRTEVNCNISWWSCKALRNTHQTISVSGAESERIVSVISVVKEPFSYHYLVLFSLLNLFHIWFSNLFNWESASHCLFRSFPLCFLSCTYLVSTSKSNRN